MAFEWTNKVDGVDDILAGDINVLAHGIKDVINRQNSTNDNISYLDAHLRDAEMKLDSIESNVYTKSEVNDKILDEREYLINGYYNKDETSAMIEAAIGTALEGEY